MSGEAEGAVLGTRRDRGTGRWRAYTAEENAAAWKARFWLSVNKAGPNGCWEWTGAIYKDGYGSMHREGRSAKVHRLSWEIAHGRAPGAQCVLHRCDNRRCVNPAHLFLGTRRDNSRDMVAKKRSLTGERDPNAQLTEREVIAIRASRDAGESCASIAQRVGVSGSEVSHITLGKRWAHVPFEGSTKP